MTTENTKKASVLDYGKNQEFDFTNMTVEEFKARKKAQEEKKRAEKAQEEKEKAEKARLEELKKGVDFELEKGDKKIIVKGILPNQYILKDDVIILCARVALDKKEENLKFKDGNVYVREGKKKSGETYTYSYVYPSFEEVGGEGCQLELEKVGIKIDKEATATKKQENSLSGYKKELYTKLITEKKMTHEEACEILEIKA